MNRQGKGLSPPAKKQDKRRMTELFLAKSGSNRDIMAKKILIKKEPMPMEIFKA